MSIDEAMEQASKNHPPHPEDIIIWPDGTECTREELPEYSFMSDDYQIIPI